MSSVRAVTLADVAWPRAGWLRNVLLILGASALTAIAARIAITVPWTPVPITGQTFAVLRPGRGLGSRRGFGARVSYSAEGPAGRPVFAGGAAGFAKLMGPTAGYLIAFPFAAMLTGALAERGWDRRFLTMLAAMLLGSSVIFTLGLAMLARFVPPGQVAAAGLLPFIPGDLVKSGLSALAFPQAWRWLRPGTRGLEHGDS